MWAIFNIHLGEFRSMIKASEARKTMVKINRKAVSIFISRRRIQPARRSLPVRRAAGWCQSLGSP